MCLLANYSCGGTWIPHPGASRRFYVAIIIIIITMIIVIMILKAQQFDSALAGSACTALVSSAPFQTAALLSSFVCGLARCCYRPLRFFYRLVNLLTSLVLLQTTGVTETSSRSAKSGAIEQFLPLDCKAKQGSQKRSVLFTDTAQGLKYLKLP